MGSKNKKKGLLRKVQSISEYVIMLSVVVAAIVGMKLYLKRAVQAKVKDLTDALISPSQSSTAVNPIIPCADSPVGKCYPTGKLVKLSSSSANSQTSRRDNAGTMTLTKSTSYSSNSKYLIKNDPDKKINSVNIHPGDK